MQSTSLGASSRHNSPSPSSSSSPSPKKKNPYDVSFDMFAQIITQLLVASGLPIAEILRQRLTGAEVDELIEEYRDAVTYKRQGPIVGPTPKLSEQIDRARQQHAKNLWDAKLRDVSITYHRDGFPIAARCESDKMTFLNEGGRLYHLLPYTVATQPMTMMFLLPAAALRARFPSDDFQDGDVRVIVLDNTTPEPGVLAPPTPIDPCCMFRFPRLSAFDEPEGYEITTSTPLSEKPKRERSASISHVMNAVNRPHQKWHLFRASRADNRFQPDWDIDEQPCTKEVYDPEGNGDWVLKDLQKWHTLVDEWEEDGFPVDSMPALSMTYPPSPNYDWHQAEIIEDLVRPLLADREQDVVDAFNRVPRIISMWQYVRNLCRLNRGDIGMHEQFGIWSVRLGAADSVIAYRKHKLARVQKYLGLGDGTRVQTNIVNREVERSVNTPGSRTGSPRRSKWPPNQKESTRWFKLGGLFRSRTKSAASPPVSVEEINSPSSSSSRRAVQGLRSILLANSRPRPGERRVAYQRHVTWKAPSTAASSNPPSPEGTPRTEVGSGAGAGNISNAVNTKRRPSTATNDADFTSPTSSNTRALLEKVNRGIWGWLWK